MNGAARLYFFFAFLPAFLTCERGLSQNIAVNTTGAAAAATNLFEVVQTSTVTNTVGIFAAHNGAATNAYAIWAEATGATNKYAIVVPVGKGSVGIGTTTPQVELHVVSDIPSATTALHPYRTGVLIEGDQNTLGGRLAIRQANTNSNLVLFRTNGTIAAPTTLISGDVMGTISFGGYDGTQINSFHGLNAIAAQTWANNANGSHLAFNTINIGSGFGSGGTEKMRITSEGNVGIGTTTPSNPLTVASGSAANATAISVLPSTNAGSKRAALQLDDWLVHQDVNINGTKDFGIWQQSSTTNRFYISTAGDVGIGTTGPNAKLQVDKSGSPASQALILSNSNGSTAAGQGVYQSFYVGNTTGNEMSRILAGNFQAGNLSHGYLAFYSRQADAMFERVRIDYNGNVGIGTTTPGDKLELASFVHNVSGPFARLNTWLEDKSGYMSGLLLSINSGSGSGTVVDAIKNIEESDDHYRMDLQTYGTSGLSTKMSVMGDGNVGIGTTAPVAKLEVDHTPAAFTHGVLYNIATANTGINLFTVWASGAGTNTGRIELRRTDTEAKDISFRIANNAYNRGMDITMPASADDIRFDMIGCCTALYLKSNGYVGVGAGTTTPAYSLEVNGTFGFGNGTAGSYRSRTESRADAGQIATQSGFFETAAPSPSADWPTSTANASLNFDASGNATSWWHLIDSRHSNNGNNYALQISGGFFDQNIYFRKTNNSASTPWSKLVTTSNSVMAPSITFPDGLSSITSKILQNGAAAWSYTVPAGKNLYITNYYSIVNAGSGALTVGGTTVIDGLSDYNNVNNPTYMKMPIIVPAGVVAAGPGSSVASGFEVSATITPITQTGLLTTPYTVTAGKTLVILQTYITGGSDMSMSVNGGANYYAVRGTARSNVSNSGVQSPLGSPLIFPAGTKIKMANDAHSFNGYEF